MLVFRTVGPGRAGYYLDGPGRGRWLGAGSRALGLEGDVDGGAFAAALAGRGPDGSPLLAGIRADRRPGFDLIFAAPKSFSLVTALAPADVAARLAAAHTAAVADVVAYLERVGTATRRAGRPVPGRGLVAAAFEHRWNRAGDPALGI